MLSVSRGILFLPLPGQAVPTHLLKQTGQGKGCDATYAGVMDQLRMRALGLPWKPRARRGRGIKVESTGDAEMRGLGYRPIEDPEVMATTDAPTQAATAGAGVFVHGPPVT